MMLEAANSRAPGAWGVKGKQFKMLGKLPVALRK